MKISFIQPSRNNLKYLKWSYDSIRKNQGNHTVEVCVADDFSSDGTWEWCQEMMEKDNHFKAIRNEGPTRLGHTILYDKLINEVATNDICIIYHADMYLCPGALDAIKKHLKEKTIVSLTRIEPPLHPDGPEKVLRDFGVEPEEFNEEGLLNEVQELKVLHENDPGVTEGIFAPWAFWKKDFQEIGGHDPLYAPQSKEDSDIFNRFQLNGIKFLQTWEGYVYHMTCRGSRRNVIDKAKNIYEDSPEWLAQNMRSTRNFIRKWGHYVEHDEYMKPIVPPKYNIGFEVINGTPQLLEVLEPWGDHILIDLPIEYIQEYIEKEQPNTQFNLSERINTNKETEIRVSIDSKKFDNNDFALIRQISKIIKDSGSEGSFELNNLEIVITNMNEYQNKLIKL